MTQDECKRAGEGASVVLDNALLFSAANFQLRQNNKQKVRNVNLFGIAALADSLVMHQRITVDRPGWEYFVNAVPPSWLPAIEPMLDIVEFDLPSQDVVVDAVVRSSNSILLGFALTMLDQLIPTEGGRDINTTYFSYTGSDLGKIDDEDALIDLLQERITVAIPDMHLHLRHHEHVSALQCLVRAVQYQSFASDLGQAYIPHEYRGRILNVISRDRVEPSFRRIWELMMARVSAGIQKEYSEKLDWTRPADDGSFALWERFEMPTFLAMALERTSDVKDLFHHIIDIRDKAMPLRHLLESFTGVQSGSDGAAIARDIRAVANELTSTGPTKAGSIFSVSVGFPPSISLRMNLPSLEAKRSVAFIRDIYDNHSVPLSLSQDLERVFGATIQPLTLDPLLGVAPSENALDFFFEHARLRSDGSRFIAQDPSDI